MIKASKSKKEIWFDRKNIITIIFLSISLSFTVFFFSPIDIFLGNQKEFYISAYYVILPMLLLAVLVSIALALILSVSLIRRTIYNAVTSLLFGILLAFYSQMMLFNGNMLLLNGDDISYSEISAANMFNYLIMYVILVMPLILTLVREKYSVMNFAKGKAISYLSALIFAMQLFGSTGMLISNGLINTDPNVYGFSLEPFMSLSEENNITVFLVDRLDDEWMDEILEAYPEMNEKLEGFTYYQNNVSAYNNTFPSVPCMLTYSEYDPKENRYGFLDRIWSEDTIPGKLYENGYRINLLLDRSTTFNEFSQLPECGNIVPMEADDFRINYFGKNGVIDTMTSLSFAKLSPYLLKDLFLFRIGSGIDNDSLMICTDLSDDMIRSVDINADLIFNKYLVGHGLKSDSEQKTFSFIHLNGAHNRSAEISQLYPSYDSSKTEADIPTTTRGDFETLFTYFDMMKELRVYDNSTIIIIADHGIPTELSASALLIKPQNAGSEPLKTNAKAELSNKYFFSSILEYAGIDHSEYGYSYNDIISDELQPERYVFRFPEDDKARRRFVITGNARGRSNWTEIPLNEQGGI